MEEVLRFALLGLGLGALYSLAAQGLIVIYRGSGVLNFAQGAIGMVAAYLVWDLSERHGMSYVPACVVGVAASAAVGALTHLLVMRPLRHSSSLARVAGTLGVLILLQGVVILIYGNDVQYVPSKLPTDPVTVVGDVTISTDRLILFGIAAAASALLWALYRWTTYGLATSAVAERERAAAALGWSPDAVATANWALGSALAGAAAVLITPIVQLQVSTMTNLVIAALAAALIASFRSFPIVFVAAILLGIVQTEASRYISTPGVDEAIPFAVIVAYMVLRGQALPMRDFFLQRLPVVGTGRVRPSLVALGIAIGVVAMVVLPVTWQEALSLTVAFALVLLSIVVLTGYAGQISLAQYAVAGLGAWVAAKLNADVGVPFVWSCLIAIIAAVPIGILFALPAVRTRGLNLAVLTLGLGTAIELLIFNSPSLSGGAAGLSVDTPSIFGFSFDPVAHPTRWGLLVIGVFVVAALAVANVRRGRMGRRMLAVRTNERAAAALGISVATTKAYAFGLAAAIATLGGIGIAFRSESILFATFTNFTSVSAVAWAVIGGVGWIMGPIIGATFAPGALGTQVGDTVLANAAEYIAPLGGLVLILLLIQSEDGAARVNMELLQRVARRLPLRRRTKSRRLIVDAPGQIQRVRPQALDVRNVTVRFGGVVAVDDLSLRIEPGTILGLIGPNGAGKTTAIDAITGFVRPASGTVTIGDRDVSTANAARRARAGISRSFQSLELFEDMTVLDNLRAACDPIDRLAYVQDVVAPATPPLTPTVLAAIDAFDLGDDLDRLARDLSFGRRRLLAIARAVATEPSVLLLDEPAAGLGDAESLELARLVRRLPDEWGMAVLLIEHDMNFVMSICDELHVLEFGRTIARGRPEDVRTDPTTIRAYLGETDAELREEGSLR
jgi:ABC-type branched-subunit amino acid transport system ATPase component/branched-subunit amino acid ABC-type transport system permease component